MYIATATTACGKHLQFKDGYNARPTVKHTGINWFDSTIPVAALFVDSFLLLAITLRVRVWVRSVVNCCYQWWRLSGKHNSTHSESVKYFCGYNSRVVSYQMSYG